MSKREPTPVRCEKCGREWNTRAEKKAICTNPSCKSTKILDLITGEKYNKTDPFISEQRKQSAKRMQIDLDEVIAEEEPQKKAIYGELFEEDGRTPKLEPQGQGDLSDLFRNLPKASPHLVAAIQNASIIPARFLGAHWYMSPEEAEWIASALVPLINELGMSKLMDWRISLAAAGLVYLIPRLVLTFFAQPKKEQVPKYQEATPPPARSKPITTAEHVEAQNQEFIRKYGGSLDEEGKDKYADARRIRKPY